MTSTSRQEQRRRLIRSPDLAAFRQTLTALALDGEGLFARRRALLLPTAASIELMRETIEAGMARSGRSAAVLPDLLTRDGFLIKLHESLTGSSPMLTRLEREVLLARAAREAAARPRVGGTPFEVRPGLVAEMLALYDEIRRRRRTVTRFASALFEELGGERGTDRGSESLVQQTTFLGFAFLGYERAVAASGAMDEHVLRARLLAANPTLPFDHLVVAVADHPADPRGLPPADRRRAAGHRGSSDPRNAGARHARRHSRGRIRQRLPGEHGS